MKVDLDLLVFAVSEDGKLPQSRDFVYFNNRSDKFGSIVLMKESKDAEGEGDEAETKPDKIPEQSNVSYFEVRAVPIDRSHPRCLFPLQNGSLAPPLKARHCGSDAPPQALICRLFSPFEGFPRIPQPLIISVPYPFSTWKFSE